MLEKVPPKAAGLQELSFSPDGANQSQYLILPDTMLQLCLGISNQGVVIFHNPVNSVKDVASAVTAVENHISFAQGATNFG